ncbi:hypothetical protein HYX58_05485 [Candidatus Dependentiae bacterium]|nr:hypothetical protein [Candidatus Dependentiae bacterium]
MEKRDISQFEEQNEEWEINFVAEKTLTEVAEPKVKAKLSLYGKLNQKINVLTETKQRGMRTIFIKIKSEFMNLDDEGRVVFADILNFGLLGLKIKNREFSPGLGCYRLTFEKSVRLEELSRLQKIYSEIAGIAPGKGVDWELLRQERERMYNAKVKQLRKK